jgi:hypothetical protein
MGRVLIRCCIGGHSNDGNRISGEEWYNCYSLIEPGITTSHEPEQSVMRRIFQKKKTYADRTARVRRQIRRLPPVHTAPSTSR